MLAKYILKIIVVSRYTRTYMAKAYIVYMHVYMIAKGNVYNLL